MIYKLVKISTEGYHANPQLLTELAALGWRVVTCVATETPHEMLYTLGMEVES